MQVIATAQGFDGHAIREKDDLFEMPEDAVGTWFEPVDAKAKKASAKALKDKTDADAAALQADLDAEKSKTA